MPDYKVMKIFSVRAEYGDDREIAKKKEILKRYYIFCFKIWTCYGENIYEDTTLHDIFSYDKVRNEYKLKSGKIYTPVR